MPGEQCTMNITTTKTIFLSNTKAARLEDGELKMHKPHSLSKKKKKKKKKKKMMGSQPPPK